MTTPTPDPGEASARGGATRAPLAPGEAPEDSPVQRGKKVWDLVSGVMSPINLLAVIGLVVIVIVGAVGGWNRAIESSVVVPVVKPGEPISANPFVLTVLRARSATELRPIAYSRDGYRHLFVVVRVTNTGDAPFHSYVLGKAIRADAEGLETVETEGQRFVKAPQVFRLIDALTSSSLQPGIGYELVLVWAQRSTAPVPRTLSLAVMSLEYDEKNPQRLDVWSVGEEAANVTVDVAPVQGMP